VLPPTKKDPVASHTMLYSRATTENRPDFMGYIEMSKETRNSGFERKSGKNRRSAPIERKLPRKAKGMYAHSAVSTPRPPKKPHAPTAADKSGDNADKSANKKGQNRARHLGKGGFKRGGSREGGALWIWGYHAVQAVLANPKRTVHDLMLTESAASRTTLPKGLMPPRLTLPAVMDKQFPSGTVHQGMAVKVAPLEWPDISDLAAQDIDQNKGLILVLDQITDPHNVGAMLRLASAFGVRALVMQDRKAPPLGGATAKVAVGCLETVPVCLVKNIGNTLQDLQKQNWLVTGLAGETELDLSTALSGGGNQVIVMGAEGPGLRPRVRMCCDQLARIPMLSTPVSGQTSAGQAESLNVATAAAIALYEARRG